MNIKHFADTDTLLIELNDSLIENTIQIDDFTFIDYDLNKNIVNITIENAIKKVNLKNINIEQNMETLVS